MHDAFYARVKRTLFRGSLPEFQREPLQELIDLGMRLEASLQDAAYVLATAYHETGRFRFMEEIGKGEGKAYGVDVPLMGTGSRVTKTARYHGRGFVQITWLANYARQAAITGEDLVGDPDLAKRPDVAAKIIWRGMIDGDFTGRKLRDYISDRQVDYVNARRIVNGMDCANQIAGYAREFEEALAEGSA